MTPQLICPHDKATLQAHAGYYHCPDCQRRYPLIDGVVCTLDKPDAFYEGAYGNQTHFLPRSEKPWHVWPLWLINSGYVWAVRKAVPAGATVVELGCAGGVRYFGQCYRMIGCDLSWAALKSLDFYPTRIQADAAACIALPDASVDAVVSSYFWEHIPPDIKPNILKECRRILKPGGKLVFLYDVETANPLIGKYKAQNPALYRKLFIEGDGHFGYQWPAENIALFKTAGFQILEHRGLDKTWIQAPSTYSKLAQFAGGGYLKPLAALGSTRGFYVWTGFMRLVDTLICPWLPERWARIDRIIAQQPLTP
ncbi:MAG: class I SAM-dependent methyltransferase [Candidatus Competibacteraceae bacterium]|nr:MAG: class I SAM-dependent methyltransferase [Candidatus Competibacteraceae bacterium]